MDSAPVVSTPQKQALLSPHGNVSPLGRSFDSGLGMLLTFSHFAGLHGD